LLVVLAVLAPPPAVAQTPTALALQDLKALSIEELMRIDVTTASRRDTPVRTMTIARSRTTRAVSLMRGD